MKQLDKKANIFQLFFVHTFITKSVCGCNELILPLLQELVNLLNVLPHVDFVVSLHVADVITCPSEKTDPEDDTGLLVRPS